MEITVPNDWRPRAYQKGLWNFLEKGGKRAVAVWHRRAGKDLLSVNIVFLLPYLNLSFFLASNPASGVGAGAGGGAGGGGGFGRLKMPPIYPPNTL